MTFIRVGSTSREATREDEGRLYQAARLVRYEIKAVSDTGLESLDMDRIENYYRDVLKRSVPDRADLENRRRLLLNSDLLVAQGDDEVGASVSGLLLFGKNPNRRLPHPVADGAPLSPNPTDFLICGANTTYKLLFIPLGNYEGNYIPDLTMGSVA